MFPATLMNELNSIIGKFDTSEPDEFVRAIHGDRSFDNDSNPKVLVATINFIKNTQRFEQALY